MKMFFLLKNNARRGMGGKGVLKKGEEKGAEKGLQNSRILKAGEALFKNFRTILRHSHNVNKSE